MKVSKDIVMARDAVFSISTPSRHPADADGYDSSRHRYRPEYVNPDSWKLLLHAWPSGTQENPQSEELTFPPDLLWLEWRIRERGGPFTTSTRSDAPNIHPRVTLNVPHPGNYEITLLLGTVGNKTSNTTRNFDLRDFLIISVGDSFASGEGNPDISRIASNSEQVMCKATTLAIVRQKFGEKAGEIVRKIASLGEDGLEAVPLIGTALAGVASGAASALGYVQSTFSQIQGSGRVVLDALSEGAEEVVGWLGWGDGGESARPAAWQEPSAHRSYRSAVSLAARQLEAQDGAGATRITFLNFARSGADLRHGVLDERIFNPDSDRIHLDRWIGSRGQIQEAKETVGDRQVDAVIVTAGINDLQFSSQVTDAILYESGEKRTARIAKATRIVETELPKDFARLREAIRREINPRMVFVTEYPVGVFDELKNGNPCGILGSEVGFNLDRDEANAMGVLGRNLNSTLRKLADESGWIFISGIEEGFQNHGYCGKESYFIGAEESCLKQGDFEGTLHPNAKGHAVARDCIISSVKQILTTRPVVGMDAVLHVMLQPKASSPQWLESVLHVMSTSPAMPTREGAI
ncbi:GDSL-type esterase/lipase family protein [Arthrobacter sp. MDT1-65]